MIKYVVYDESLEICSTNNKFRELMNFESIDRNNYDSQEEYEADYKQLHKYAEEAINEELSRNALRLENVKAVFDTETEALEYLKNNPTTYYLRGGSLIYYYVEIYYLCKETEPDDIDDDFELEIIDCTHLKLL